jgi:hypothetical protein
MNGSKYEGTFINGERDGKGVLTFSNKDRCTFPLFLLLMVPVRCPAALKLSLRPADRSPLSSSSMCRYDGDWKQGKKEGTGTYLWANGSIYQGEYVNGKKEGKGIMIYNNGTRCRQVAHPPCTSVSPECEYRFR